MTKPIYRILLDMDDVLNTCGPSIFKLFGLEGYPFDPKMGWNILGNANHHLKGLDPNHEPLGIKEFWDAIPGDFWGEIPKSANCDALVTRCIELVGEDEVYIATAPTKCSDSMASKHSWILNNLPECLHRNFFITPRKWLLGKPGVLLIDDHQQNIFEFRREGGLGIIHPQPWNLNHQYSDANLEYTLSALDDLPFGEKR